MHAATAVISLITFVTSICAAPIPTKAAARAVPDISEVARNPAPIDNRVHWEDGKPSLGDADNVSWEDVQKLKELIHHLSGETSGGAVSLQTHNGLGRDISLLTQSQLAVYRKAEYANNLLYIATLGFAKLSIISLLMILTASKTHRNLGLSLAGFIALWTVFSICLAAFQCGTTEPWRFLGNEEMCFNIVSFWRSVGAINILTDLALTAFPVHVVMTLQMSMSKKITILTFFGARSLDIVATAVQMVYLDGFTSPNPTKALWKWTLLAQIIECITIITSCVPYIRPLLESVPSGLYASDDLRRRGTSSEHGVSRSKNSSYQLSSIASRFGTGITRSSRKSLHAENTGIKRFLPMFSQDKTTHANSASGIPGGPRRLDGATDVEITAVHHRNVDDKSWETASTGSHSKILKTMVVSAEWEEAEVKGHDGSSDEIEIMHGG
ncbi:hypothetical protein COCVIDRAFT_41763 [Bipolaris victoriae FI3]|uniref:Rhodopsin domain-containing protein n=1 Tax=Bipolaris victoriae (strain FI3) TaxID=930091 RepID=W7E1X9_BIPV3|nr:hypothetical protein COCVIDRAFT_41763 [Bipolaris victoriae FI3]